MGRTKAIAQQSDPKPASASKKAKPAKKLSAYNTYMKSELLKLKAEKPDMPHNERFKIVAQRWKTAKENPKAAA